MSEAYAHLGPAAAEFIDGSAEERIARILSRRFTDYPRCQEVLQIMKDQLQQPKGCLKPNLLIWGESGQGKSTIIQKHVREFPPVFDKTAGIRRTPVVAIEMPPLCDIKWFYSELLRAIGAPPEPRGQSPVLLERILNLYQILGVRQIVIDESHNMLVGSIRQQRGMLTAIRHLSNQLEIPLVLAGTRDAREALLHDPQLTRRFRFEELPAWQSDAGFQALVISVVRSLPLREPSVFTARSLNALIKHSDGITAGIFDVLIQLAVRAIQSGEECINVDAVMDYVNLGKAA